MSTKSYMSIVMDFRKAREQADQLDRQAKRMRTLANDEFGGVIRSVDKNWQGENASAYIQKCEVLKGRILRSAADLSSAARTIRTVATNTYNAEMRAWEIANRRR